MKYIIGAIVMYVIMKIANNRRRQLFSQGTIMQSPQPFVKMVFNLAGIDMICRLLKFFLIYIATNLIRNARFMVGHVRLIHFGNASKLQKIANFFGIIRILSRYPRTRGLYEDLHRNWTILLSQKEKTKMLEIALGFIGDLLNIIYFIFDHYMGLHLLGMFDNKLHLDFADFWGNLIWTGSSFFYLLRNFVMIYRYMQTKNPIKTEEATLFRMAVTIDFSRNLLDTIINYAFAYPGVLDMKTLSVMSMAAAGLWMTDFWLK